MIEHTYLLNFKTLQTTSIGTLFWYVFMKSYILKSDFAVGTFSTDTPPLFVEVEGVQEVSLALGHDKPVSVGYPLYNEASAIKGCLVLFPNVFV